MQTSMPSDKLFELNWLIAIFLLIRKKCKKNLVTIKNDFFKTLSKTQNFIVSDF